MGIYDSKMDESGLGRKLGKRLREGSIRVYNCFELYGRDTNTQSITTEIKSGKEYIN